MLKEKIRLENALDKIKLRVDLSFRGDRENEFTVVLPKNRKLTSVQLNRLDQSLKNLNYAYMVSSVLNENKKGEYNSQLMLSFYPKS